MTNPPERIVNFAIKLTLLHFHVIAFTHHTIGVDEIGKFHLEEGEVLQKMSLLKAQMNLKEIMYLSTCNRVEFVFVGRREIDEAFKAVFLNEFNPQWDDDHIRELLANAKCWNGINAVNHLIEVASSLDSMVIGEREIITQMKEAYAFSRKNKLSGDTIRIVMRQVVETAKKVYTQTNIATKPVSMVSLAYQQLKKKGLSKNSRVLIIGAGVTNTNMGRFLKKHGFHQFTVFNRSIERAERLADLLNGKAQPLDALKNHSGGFDLLLSCTGSTQPIITKDIYTSLLAGEEDEKTIIDLAVPSDIDKSVKKTFNVDHISVKQLKEVSDQNIALRKKELIKVRQIIFEAVEEFKEIFKMRQVEIKMRSIPERVKEIRSTALDKIFSRELEELDENSRELLEKILNYMEKKYVAVPMIAAKEMFAKKQEKHED
ncbi:MAG: glutamyl-tRNA reductase [Crocinitomicaceae bacterium]